MEFIDADGNKMEPHVIARIIRSRNEAAAQAIRRDTMKRETAAMWAEVRRQSQAREAWILLHQKGAQ